MNLETILRHSCAPAILVATASLLAPTAARADGPTATKAVAEAPARTIAMSVGSGQLVRLPRPMTGMFVADDKIADVQVKGPTALYLFAKAPGATSVYATDRSGAVIWSSDVRVGNNLTGVTGMLRMAMPDADIAATPVGGMILLSGTALSAKDVEEAQHLTEAFTGPEVKVINRIHTATPQQVSLQVKIVEVSRSVAKDIGVNLLSRDTSGGFLFGIGQGNPGTIKTVVGAVDPTTGALPGATAFTFNNVAGTTLGFAGHALGLDILSTLQLAENNGLVSTLAEPTLTALSGETASFLAGGEIPIPQSEGLGAVSVIFKQYGVSLAFTPYVLANGTISMRVRPEVSQLSDAGSVKLGGFTVPALTTRRAETTVVLGSGQSFVIGGLLQNNHNNSTSKAPFLGDLPILGTLFRSNSFRKEESELVIVVTPYLVKPVDANRIALPTDGYRSPTTTERVLLNKMYDAAPAVPSKAQH
jgi:pilus assembly protein CpaC